MTLKSVISGFRLETETALIEALDGIDQVALLDFPSHMNVGDGMIWAGERAYLGSLGIRVRYTCDIERYSPIALNRMLPTGAILLHGGGNLGDVWPKFQAFRERVVQDFPGRKIIQLPQTLFYDSPTRARETDRIFGNHPDLTVMLRDENSMERAEKLLPSVRTVFVRDMALGWSPDVPASNMSRNVLILARRDTESKGSTASLAKELSNIAEVEVADWGLKALNHAKWKAVKIPGRVARQNEVLLNLPLTAKVLAQSYERMLKMNLHAGIHEFSNRKLIITDRLHAHVLASLMQIPHVVLDNSYGKVRSIYEDYTHQFPSARFATSQTEALELASELLTKGTA
ncbi:polysaccharide pyruvyl transferase family protein [Arthrobacter sp. SLBN-122]|uniref:polysaccharide pyruvyl transferase family protein n=1 Tax=Arthrobacter sp. SLBN-122 TaxID=2768455 RepID=UPI001169382D|nr:polysaccharide pyruvyl transferase family protein [Arthrobacter sp. SLBN-122]TQJ33600.1 pyruvyl transferase EpsO [Arthrobacter sp. SLBN-122]